MNEIDENITPIESNLIGYTTATKEIDRPLTDSDSRHIDLVIKPTPMSDELKQKLEYSWKIVMLCVGIIGILILTEVISGFMGRTFKSDILITAMDLMRTVILLAAGFLFGNQSKN